MGTKRPPKPLTHVVQPIDERGLDAALRLFVASFVTADKRTQTHKRLLTSARRGETLAAVLRWVVGNQAVLEGADRSPAGLHARFGEVLGVHLDETGARRTTISGALELARGRASLFIGDTGRIAMITAADGPATLCARV